MEQDADQAQPPIPQMPAQVMVTLDQQIMADFNMVDMDDVDLMVGLPNRQVFQWRRAYNKMKAGYEQVAAERDALRAQVTTLQTMLAGGSGKSTETGPPTVPAQTPEEATGAAPPNGEAKEGEVVLSEGKGKGGKSAEH